MKTLFLNSILLVLFCNPFPQFAQERPWDMQHHTEKMKIYTRLSDKSDFKELKMDVLINAAAEDILEYISIASKFPEWIYSCEEAYSFKSSSKKDVYYIRFDMPWPIEDRDIVQYSITTKDPETAIIDIETKAVDGYVGHKSNVVRIIKNRITWKIIPLGTDKTRIHYYAINDPGGWVPAWLMNMVVTIGPRNTMENLMEALE